MSGGKKNVQVKSYTTACDWLLATAPLLHTLDAWSDKNHYGLGRADLSLVVAGGAVNLSGHIPKTAIAVETYTIPGSAEVTVAHAADFVTPLGSPPVKYNGAQALDYSGPNPPGLGEYQVAAGVYTFNIGDIGASVVISYAYSTGAVDDADFFAVLGVAAEVSVDEAFEDYGDPATMRTRIGVQRRWLWNAFWDPPEAGRYRRCIAEWQNGDRARRLSHPDIFLGRQPLERAALWHAIRTPTRRRLRICQPSRRAGCLFGLCRRGSGSARPGLGSQLSANVV
jgi:hypothetical protein